MKVQLANKTWYLTADKTTIVEEGDERAAFLLCRKGSPIEPTVAAFYGVETYQGDAVSKVARDPDEERAGMITPGTNDQTAQNYKRMQIGRAVREQVRSGAQSQGVPGGGRQAGLMAEAITNDKTGNTGDAYRNPQDALAVGGVTHNPVPEQRAEEAAAETSGDLPEASNVKTKQIGGGEQVDPKALAELEDALKGKGDAQAEYQQSGDPVTSPDAN